MDFYGIYIAIITRSSPVFFEKNDWFFVIFAVPSMLLIGIGTYENTWWLQATGFGIMLYGFAYFMVHDVIIHQRFKWFGRSKKHLCAGNSLGA